MQLINLMFGGRSFNDLESLQTVSKTIDQMPYLIESGELGVALGLAPYQLQTFVAHQLLNLFKRAQEYLSISTEDPGLIERNVILREICQKLDFNNPQSYQSQLFIKITNAFVSHVYPSIQTHSLDKDAYMQFISEMFFRDSWRWKDPDSLILLTMLIDDLPNLVAKEGALGCRSEQLQANVVSPLTYIFQNAQAFLSHSSSPEEDNFAGRFPCCYVLLRQLCEKLDIANPQSKFLAKMSAAYQSGRRLFTQRHHSLVDDNQPGMRRKHPIDETTDESRKRTCKMPSSTTPDDVDMTSNGEGSSNSFNDTSTNR